LYSESHWEPCGLENRQNINKCIMPVMIKSLKLRHSTLVPDSCWYATFSRKSLFRAAYLVNEKRKPKNVKELFVLYSKIKKCLWHKHFNIGGNRKWSTVVTYWFSKLRALYLQHEFKNYYFIIFAIHNSY
jgi:hypothetical protein